MRVRAAHIIIRLISRVSEFFEFIYYEIIAALTVRRFSEIIVNLFSSVKRKHNIAHLLAAEVDDLVVNQHTVRSQCETETFVVFFLLFASVLYQLLAYFPVEQRLTAKEIDLKVFPRSAVFNQKVKRPFACFKTHQSFVRSAVFTFACKAVFAVQVTAVRHVKTDGLNYTLALFEVGSRCFKGVFCKKPAVGNQRRNVFKAKVNVLVGHVSSVLVFFKYVFFYFLF